MRRLWISCHPDDHLLFMSPDLLHAVQAGDTVLALHLNAGDAGGNAAYYQGRETGTQAGFSSMAGVANTWTTADAGIPGHLAPQYTCTPAPNLSLIFLRLPDGNTTNAGFPLYGNQTMENLWNGGLTSITPDDGTATYTKAQLITAIAYVITSFNPQVIHTHEAFGDFGHQTGDGTGLSADHPDHHATGLFAAAAIAQAGYPDPITYQGFPATFRPTNVTGADATAKNAAYTAYSAFDVNAGGSTIYEPIQYRTSGPGVTVVTAVASGANSFAGGLLRVMVLTQAATTQNGGTAGSAAAADASVTTIQTGSRVYGASTFAGTVTLAASALSTQIDAVNDSVNTMSYGSYKATSLTGTPGATLIGDTNGSLCAMAEIRTAGTLTEDASAPPVSQVNVTTVQHSAEFSPPPGSLVLALWAMNSASSSSPAVAVSGGGWTWAQLKLTFGAAGAATVWYAFVPAAPGSVPSAPAAIPPGRLSPAAFQRIAAPWIQQLAAVGGVTVYAKAGGAATSGLGTGLQETDRIEQGGGVSSGLGIGVRVTVYTKTGGGLTAGLGIGAQETDRIKTGGGVTSGLGTGAKSLLVKRGGGVTPGLGTGLQETDRIEQGGGEAPGLGIGVKVLVSLVKTGGGETAGLATGFKDLLEFPDSGGGVSSGLGVGVQETDRIEQGGGISAGLGTGFKDLLEFPDTGGGVSSGLGTGVQETDRIEGGGGAAPGLGTGFKDLLEFPDTGGAISAGLGTGLKSVANLVKTGGGLSSGTGTGLQSTQRVKTGGGETSGTGIAAKSVTSLIKTGGGVTSGTGIAPKTVTPAATDIKTGGGEAPGLGTGSKLRVYQKTGGGCTTGTGGGTHSRTYNKSGAATAPGCGIAARMMTRPRTGAGCAGTIGTGFHPPPPPVAVLLGGLAVGEPHGRWSAGEPHGRYAAGEPHGRWSAGEPHG